MKDPAAIGAMLQAKREELGLSEQQAWELIQMALPLAEARYRALGADLARLRREQGLTQGQIATTVGISTATVSRYERGQWGQNNLLVLAYAYAMGVPFDIELVPASDNARHGAAR